MKHTVIRPQEAARNAQRPMQAGALQQGEEQRGAERYSLLIRPAKLVAPQGEFVCVLRDVSASGMSVKLFHRLPPRPHFTLELQSGLNFEVERVWEREGEAGFTFVHPVDVATLINEMGAYPRRGLRLALSFPITISTAFARFSGIVENISQQGARLACDELFAIDQSLRLEGSGLRETRAKVRWRDGEHYGVVFDDTYSLREFACLAARLQAPGLLAGIDRA